VLGAGVCGACCGGCAYAFGSGFAPPPGVVVVVVGVVVVSGVVLVPSLELVSREPA
jgi:hypothetical protein